MRESVDLRDETLACAAPRGVAARKSSSWTVNLKACVHVAHVRNFLASMKTTKRDSKTKPDNNSRWDGNSGR